MKIICEKNELVANIAEIINKDDSVCVVDWSKQMLLAEGSPLHQWFNRAMLTTLIEEHHSARIDHGKRLYALARLGVWAGQKD